MFGLGKSNSWTAAVAGNGNSCSSSSHNYNSARVHIRVSFSLYNISSVGNSFTRVDRRGNFLHYEKFELGGLRALHTL